MSCLVILISSYKLHREWRMPSCRENHVYQSRAFHDRHWWRIRQHRQQEYDAKYVAVSCIVWKRYIGWDTDDIKSGPRSDVVNTASCHFCHFPRNIMVLGIPRCQLLYVRRQAIIYYRGHYKQRQQHLAHTREVEAVVTRHVNYGCARVPYL